MSEIAADETDNRLTKLHCCLSMSQPKGGAMSAMAPWVGSGSGWGEGEG